MSQHTTPPWMWAITDKNIAEGHLTSVGLFDESWYQGRGVFGGLTAAVFLQSMIELEANRPPRTMTLHCVAPVLAGRGRIEIIVEKRGAKVSHLTGRLTQDSKLVAFASASFGESRSYQTVRPSLAAPLAPPPKEVNEVPIDLPIMPDFCRHFSYKFCLDALPYTQSEQAAMGGWCRLRNDYPISYPYIACILDAWAPAIFPTLKAPMRAASVDFTYHFLSTPTELESLELPFLYRGEILSLHEGYAEERDWLWAANGRPVATARQLYAIS